VTEATRRVGPIRPLAVYHETFSLEDFIQKLPELIARNESMMYSYDGTAMTVDPVSTANPGWDAFLDACNELCDQHGGIPLLNQTSRVTRAQSEKGLGDRLKVFAETRKMYDPGNQLLSGFSQDLLAE
jgi:hypothetical protein